MVQKEWIDYVRANKDQYPLDAIHRALLNGGAAPAEADEAIRLGTDPGAAASGAPPAPAAAGQEKKNVAWILFSFEGRLNRQPYWLVGLGAFVLNLLVHGSMILGFALGIAMLWVNFAVLIKRWHDRGKSGWWSLLILVPIIGWLWIFIECGFLKGTDGPNEYGPDPLQV